MMDYSSGTEKLKISNLIKTLKYRFGFNRLHKNYFFCDGILIFVGPQGSGKTLSAVNYVYNLKKLYPKAKIVTNLFLKDFPVVTFEEYLINCDLESNVDFYSDYLKKNEVFPFVNNDDLMNYSNGEHGVIFLIDEIQLYLNSLESKNINMDVMTQISQQRKQRKHIVCTSQVFGRIAKPLREQFSHVVLCKNYLNLIQYNKLLDRDDLDSDSSTGTDLSGTVKRKFLWFHSPEFYTRYDTYAVIEKGKFLSNEERSAEIYANIELSTNN